MVRESAEINGNEDDLAMLIKLTERQGQYLSYIHSYMKLNGRSPAEVDIQKYFGVTAPTAHQMVVKLESIGAIQRQAGVARSIEVLVSSEHIPVLK